ncbi:hypothetical protein ZIOFF_043484 [Zingiber officinale]|uniref:Uncharacterized protein n=1 Tax=Zingiber officinale TaxID=94328 RepID=A0A8J5G3L3_ZINOF|nr:hypothetical protein ZIOFF_043484 [Zingiber officinale]
MWSWTRHSSTSQWTPKIVDFDMARLFLEDQTHVHTRVTDTNVMNDVLSVKADVFSFGCSSSSLSSAARTPPLPPFLTPT